MSLLLINYVSSFVCILSKLTSYCSISLLTDLSHLNNDSTKLLTPKEEIEETAKEMAETAGDNKGQSHDSDSTTAS